ncbi:MAG TPA: protein kinase, partial [Kofleriaceae bacterium]|nr:protein kinase [Kofleriaceae bacterium]
MTGPDVRATLARIAAAPEEQWAALLAEAFPDDRALRIQGLLWLRADREQIAGAEESPSLGEGDLRYELAVRLDRGATASVWQARDRKLGRNLAIKVFHDHSETLDQVFAEARAASDVISDHVVRVLDVYDGGAHPYIVMELVEEHDPDRGELVLGGPASSCRPRGTDEVARWVMQVARGVHDAHLRNVFHRDLKPQNVLVTPISRRARIADFGLAVSEAAGDLGRASAALLVRGAVGQLSVRGTPEYMSPEQARGLPLALDPRSAADRGILVGIDVWGLGALAYDLLSGGPPWHSRPGEALDPWELAASGARPAPLERTAEGEAIPRRLRRIVERALAAEPAARYANAAQVAAELEAYLARRPTSFDRSRAVRFGLWCRRNPQLALTGMVAIALTLFVAGAHQTVAGLRAERDGLDREVAAQGAEERRLRQSVGEARTELERTEARLAGERDALEALKRLLERDRKIHAALLEAKEQALREANTATRQLVEQLDAATSDQRTAELGQKL